MEIKIDADIQIPITPNFICFKMRKDEEGYGHKINIKDLTDKELATIGLEYTRNLIESARHARGEKTGKLPPITKLNEWLDSLSV